MSSRREVRRRSAPLAALCGCLLLAGCAGPGRIGARPQGPAPSYASLAAVQNARVEAMRHAWATGVVEIEWTEAGKRHLEQGDATLWIELPRRTALRVAKLGDTLLWIGSDERRAWFFDLLSDPTRRTTVDHDEPAGGPGQPPIRPLMLLTAMGLTPLPDAGGDPPRVIWEDGADAGWAVDVPADTGRATIVFDAGELHPVRIDVHGDGDTVVRSRLSDYGRVPVPGRATLAAPKMAERVEMTGGDGKIRLFLREWSGNVTHQPMDRVFDLDGLTAALRPEVREP